jgi:two-component system chemotaxis response regulator CheY
MIDQRMQELNILVADDDAMVRTIMVEYLKDFGFRNILECKNGEMALKFINNKDQLIDLIISDWEMPKIDGLTLLKAVRRHPLRAKTKFIMCTSQASRERIKISQARQWQVDGYIVKPFRGEILKQKIFAVLGWIPETQAS